MPNVYKKRSPNNPVNLTTGKSIRFEDFGVFGFYVTDDPMIIAEFDICMKAGRGGVQLSTMDEYQEAIKKKLNSPISSNKSIREIQTSGLVTILQIPTATVPEVVVAESAAAVVDKPVAASQEPRVGRRK